MAEADRPVLIEARGDAEGHLLAAAELVGAVVVVDEEIGEVEVQGRRADPGEHLAAAGGKVVLVEAEAVKQVERIERAERDPTDHVGQLLSQSGALEIGEAAGRERWWEYGGV